MKRTAYYIDMNQNALLTKRLSLQIVINQDKRHKKHPTIDGCGLTLNVNFYSIDSE